ncbi:MAG: hypothetical protein KKE50_00075 [Nanoarchaeota archaeon]|nr:hypothetical protein [Nanoarchaeota archaeon]
MGIKKTLATLVLAGMCILSPPQTAEAQAQTPERKIERYDGFCYGPFRKNENPDKGVYPTKKEIEEDLSFVSKFTGKIRTYGNTDTLSAIPEICEKNNLDCYVGAWLGKERIENEKEINALLKIAKSENKNIKGLIVGNEVTLRRDLKKQELSDLIKKVNDTTDIPVGTAEIWGSLVENKDIAKNADFILVHVHPYWEGIPIEKAPEYVIERYKQIKEMFPDKKVMIGETGWPSRGKAMRGAVPSEENQKKFFKEFTGLAKKEKVPYFYFEAFDEDWKNKFEGEAGAYWGVLQSSGKLKPLFLELFNREVKNGIERKERKVEKILLKSGAVVYNEAGSSDNKFEPTGYMGELESIAVERDCKDSPYSGKTCTKIKFSPQAGLSWAGVYWQYPINNWGDYPGYEMKDVSKLTFWARGDNGNEKAEFKVGGINRDFHKDSTKKYGDSFGPKSTSIINLTKEWKKYEIDLKREDLRSIIGGFCWTANAIQNPRGCKIYLDNIIFE